MSRWYVVFVKETDGAVVETAQVQWDDETGEIDGNPEPSLTGTGLLQVDYPSWGRVIRLERAW